MPKPGADLTEVHADLGTLVLRSYPAIGNLQTVELPAGASVENAIAAFQATGLVEYAEPDRIVRPLLDPNDSYYGNGSLWNLANSGQFGGMAGADIKAAQAWDMITDASSITVAVIDTGAWLTHEDLALNLWTNPGEIPGNGIDDDGNGYVDDVHGINAITETGDPTDDVWHGSHISGIIGGKGNNSVGVVGVCWQVKIMSCKFINSGGSGLVSDAIECIDYARTKGAKIINASWGDYVQGVASLDNPGLNLDTSNFHCLYNAVSSARQAGIIFVAACGNSGVNNDNTSTRLFPASFDVDNVDTVTGEPLPALDNIIAVAATTRNDERWVNSNFGATTVNLGTGGLDIWSCSTYSESNPNNNYTETYGTSQAAAYISGACALVWAKYPTENYQQIITRILTAVEPVASLAGKCKTGGRLNLYRALAANGNGMWNNTGSMTGRRLHTATVLGDGRVLAAGGDGATLYLSSMQLYNPAGGTWAATTAMNPGRDLHTATLLPNGTVLIAGGYNAGALNSAGVYDAVAQTWTTASPMGSVRAEHSATLLYNGNNGKVLVAGGFGASGSAINGAELYDSTAVPPTWTATAGLNTARYGHTATLLPDGKVLVAGGVGSGGYLNTAEIYDPAGTPPTWTTIAQTMTVERYNHAATLLPNGKVLITGGRSNSGYLDTAELCDPTANPPTWTLVTQHMSTARYDHTATLLSNGKVVVAGGQNSAQNVYLSSAELYD